MSLDNKVENLLLSRVDVHSQKLMKLLILSHVKVFFYEEHDNEIQGEIDYGNHFCG